MEHKVSDLGARTFREPWREHHNVGDGRDDDLLVTWARMICSSFAWYEAGFGLWSAMTANGSRNRLASVKPAGRAAARHAVDTRSLRRGAIVIPFVRRPDQARTAC